MKPKLSSVPARPLNMNVLSDVRERVYESRLDVARTVKSATTLSPSNKKTPARKY